MRTNLFSLNYKAIQVLGKEWNVKKGEKNIKDQEGKEEGKKKNKKVAGRKTVGHEKISLMKTMTRWKPDIIMAKEPRAERVI